MLIATVDRDVDTLYIVVFDSGKVVGSECEAPCGVLEDVLLDAATVKVVPVPPSTGVCVVEFGCGKGGFEETLTIIVELTVVQVEVLSRHEVDSIGVRVLVEPVLLVIAEGAVE